MLPKIPQAIDDAIGANGKPIIIKKNIFEKNLEGHKDVAPENNTEHIVCFRCFFGFLGCNIYDFCALLLKKTI